MKKKIKFQQICTAPGILFALDTSGDLWFYANREWQLHTMPMLDMPGVE